MDIKAIQENKKEINLKLRGVEIVSPGPDHLPLVVSLTSDSTNVAEWCARNRDWIDAELLKVGAILFRGFPVQSVERFDEFTTTVFDEPSETGGGVDAAQEV